MSSKFESYKVPFLSNRAVAIKWLSDTKSNDTFSHFSVQELRGVFDTARLSVEEIQDIFRIRTRQLKRKSKQDIRRSDKIGEIKEEMKIEELKWHRDQLVAEKLELCEEIEDYARLAMMVLIHSINRSL